LTYADTRWEDIFPDDYRNAKAFLNAPKKFEARRQVEADAMLNYAQHTAQRLSYNANTNLIESDNFQHVLGPLLKRLSYRERTILELRYGLDKESEGTCHTLEEIGYILKVSKERVRQGEVKALRRIKGMALENNIVIEDFFDK
jgi:RNA polymerase sigma factor (sigma-70 family)